VESGSGTAPIWPIEPAGHYQHRWRGRKNNLLIREIDEATAEQKPRSSGLQTPWTNCGNLAKESPG